jgi:hypothetical protein
LTDQGQPAQDVKPGCPFSFSVIISFSNMKIQNVFPLLLLLALFGLLAGTPRMAQATALQQGQARQSPTSKPSQALTQKPPSATRTALSTSPRRPVTPARITATAPSPLPAWLMPGTPANSTTRHWLGLGMVVICGLGILLVLIDGFKKS